MGNLLTLEEFRQVLGYNPWHFWGLGGAKAPVKSACNAIINEYSWQSSDAAGRAEIAAAIERAEGRIAKHLGYNPAPMYEERTLRWPSYHDSNWRRTWSVEPDGRRVSMDLQRGYVQAIGSRRRTVLGNVSVAVYDKDKDCVLDGFKCTLTTAETDASLLSLEFVDGDLPIGETVDRTVRPIVVTISGGRAEFTGKTWLIVRPVLREGVSTDGLAADDKEVYAKTLQVVKTEYISGQLLTDGSAILRWESRPCGSCWFCSTYASPNEPATTYYAVGRGGIRDAKLGYVTPDRALWDATNQVWRCEDVWGGGYSCGVVEPDTVTMRFVSGHPLENGRMAASMRNAVARLAMAELSRDVCGCSDANRELNRWQFDIALTSDDNDTFQISQADLDNPFGTARGAIWAWKQVKDYRLRKAVPV